MTKNILILLLVVTLSACNSLERVLGSSEDANSYKPDQVGRLSQVLEGKIIAIREVEISGTKALGAGTGGAIGAVAGSTVNNAETDRIVAGALGAVAGAVIGGFVEEKVTEKVAWEFVIAFDSGEKKSFVQNPNQDLKVGDAVFIIETRGQVRITKKVSYNNN